MKRTVAIARYENFLLHGRAISLSKDEREQNALDIIRYIVINLMRKKPQDAMKMITPKIAKKYHIDALVKYIDAPPDIRKNEDYWYYIHRAFPKETKVNHTAQVLQIYKDILAGKRQKFPPRYFMGAAGQKKSEALLRYLISNHAQVNNIGELYERFAKPNIGNTLRKWKVLDVCKYNYTSPLEWLHESLGPAEKDEFLYRVLLHRQVYDLFEKRIKKQKKGARIS